MKQETIYGDGFEVPLSKEKESKGARTRVLTAIGLGVAITAILGIVAASLPAVGHVNSGNPGIKASAVAAEGPSQLSAKVSGSSVITISDYHSGGYSSGLQCLVDLFSIYCDGSAVSIQGFPAGIHTFTVIEKGRPSSLEFRVS